MERGKLGIEDRQKIFFVFDDLVAKLARPRAEALSLRLHQWESAVEAWQFDLQVCDFMNACIYRYNTIVEVVTWRPKGFAEALKDRLWELDVPVERVRSGDYPTLSQHFAMDTEVLMIFDPDPNHRFGYGFKAREFSAGMPI
jgi:hypothetical protein